MNPGDYPLNGSPFHVPPSYAQPQHPQQHGTGQGSPGTPGESGSPHAMQHSSFPYTAFTYPNHSYPQYPQYPQPIMMYGHARAQPHPTQAGPSPTPSTSTKPAPTSAKRKSLLLALVDSIHVQLTTSPSLQVVATIKDPQRLPIIRSEPRHSVLAIVAEAERSGRFHPHLPSTPPKPSLQMRHPPRQRSSRLPTLQTIFVRMHILPTDHRDSVQKEENGGRNSGSREGEWQGNCLSKD
jgi:hypothetical protein